MELPLPLVFDMESLASGCCAGYLTPVNPYYLLEPPRQVRSVCLPPLQ